ncbi:MAG: dihydromonapterin reductase [Halothiobacillaceae bacterium]|jgi:dihydromonapterin reductase/dihydrofolate reductase|nr:dihydromonapterin reductase [Halothiobacillaceae bacterium]MDY0049881.1 dihydromonapterin reductase [Halothiobacillaceae bacterium]
MENRDGEMRPLPEAVVITGAAQRLGLYHAERLLEQGYAVIGSYRREKPGVAQLRALGARMLPADFSTREGILAFIAALKDNAQSLRAIIHNASLWTPDADILEEPVAFDVLMNVHVQAPYLINLHAEPLLRTGEGPRDIIHITDYAVERGSDRHAAYVASKAALASLTLSFAKRYAPRIRVNTIAPGLIQFNAGDDEEYRKRRLALSALGFEPGPDVVWQAIRFLMDNPFVTGASLPVDGGRRVRGG